MKKIILWGIGILLFLFSTFAALYEGSGLLENTFEWTHSTPFTHLLYGQPGKPDDISRLDYLVYAAKYKPFYPMIMFFSGKFLAIVAGYCIIGKDRKWLSLYLTVLGLSMLIMTFLISNSFTAGGKLFSYLFLASGLILILSALLFQVSKRRLKAKKAL